MTFQRPEHVRIAKLLRQVRQEACLSAGCYFAEGTAIVMLHGEYRLSLDVDFLCASTEGYRSLREACFERGIDAFFTSPVTILRDMRSDAYGIRCLLAMDEQPIRFEIIREARIDLSGAMSPTLGIPLLSSHDLFAEKLLANADRGMDKSTAYRDAFDLGMLVAAHSAIPRQAIEKAEKAYGSEIGKKARWVAARLADRDERHDAAASLQMSKTDADHAAAALGAAVVAAWP